MGTLREADRGCLDNGGTLDDDVLFIFDGDSCDDCPLPISFNDLVAIDFILCSFRNAFQKSRYELLHESKYSCGRQIMWNAFVHANFYFDMKKFIENMSWMGIANLDKKML